MTRSILFYFLFSIFSIQSFNAQNKESLSTRDWIYQLPASDTIQGGTIPINAVIDLSEYAVVDGVATQYQAVNNAMLYPFTPSVGVYKLPEQVNDFYQGQTMTWSMINKNFSNGVKYFRFTVGKADMSLYHPTDLEGLKKFLNQDGLGNKKNYEHLGLTSADMQRWDADAIAKLKIGWGAETPTRVKEISMFTTLLEDSTSGIFDISYFPSLEFIYSPLSFITGLELKDNTKLTKINLRSFGMFSTMPLPSSQFKSYYYNFEPIADRKTVYKVGDIFDFSSEYIVGGKKSTYEWTTQSGGKEYPIELIDLGNGKFQIPLSCIGRTLQLSIKNENFPNAQILRGFFQQVQAADGTFKQSDTDILKNFLIQKVGDKYNYEYCNLNAEQMQQWNGDVISKLSGITWTNDIPVEVKSINWADYGFEGTIDVTGLKSLEYLNVGSNNLTDIKIDNPKLSELFVNDNKLTLKNLPLIKNLKTYVYAPQSIIDGGTIPINSVIDLSEYAVINGVDTKYETINSAPLYPFTSSAGIFKIPEQVNDYYLNDASRQTWRMTNANFPELTLQYSFTITKADMSLYHPTDLEGLKKFLNQDGLGNKKNYEHLGLTSADMQRWDADAIAKLKIGWSAETPTRVKEISMFTTLLGDSTSGIFDISYFPSLEIIYSPLSSITGLKLKDNTKLTEINLTSFAMFSTMPLPSSQFKSYYYNFRSIADRETVYKVGDILDFSSEYIVGGKKSTYEWTNLFGNNGIESPIELIDLGNGKFQIPLSCIGQGLGLNIKNENFPNAQISRGFFQPVKAADGTFKQSDTDILKNFLMQKVGDKYNYEYCNLNAEQMQQWNGDVISKLSGITWTNDIPVEVKSINWADYGFEGVLDVTGLKSLEYLNVGSNNLTDIKIDNPKLSELFVNDNKLTLANLPLIKNLKTYVYAPQSIIDGGTIPINSVVDLSEYAVINGVDTKYETINNAPLYPFIVSTGIFKIPEQVSDFYLNDASQQTWRMTNANFPELTQQYSFTITKADMSNYHSMDLEGLKKFLNQDGLGNKKNYEHLGLTSADMQRWDADVIAKLKIGWSGTTPARIQKIDNFSQWYAKDISGTLDVSYFPMIEELALQGTALNGLKVNNNDKLTSIELSGTNVLFSTMPLPAAQYKKYSYEILKVHTDETKYEVGDVIDYGSEYLINNVKTKFEWFVDGVQTSEVIDLDLGKFEIPLSFAGKKIICKMTNSTFPNAIVTMSIPNVAGLSVREYKASDLKVLQSFLLQKTDNKYNYLYFNLTDNDMNNWDVNTIKKLKGVEWTNTYPMEIKSIVWSNIGFGGDLNLDGLNSLETLDCSHNNLTSVKVNSPKLSKLAINDNKLTFKGLPILAIKDYNYADQEIIDDEMKSVSQVIDLSDQYIINNTVSTYKWQADNVEVKLTDLGNGKFIAGQDLNGKTLVCDIKNTSFPALTLKYIVSIDATTTGIEDDKRQSNSIYLETNVINLHEYLTLINTTDYTGNGMLFNLKGNMIKSFKITDSNTTISIESKGIYILYVTLSNGTNKTFKVIVR